MAKALKIIGTGLVIAGLAVVTGGAALGFGLALSTTAFGISAGALIAAGSLLSSAGSLMAPRARAPAMSSSAADRLTVSMNLRAPRLSVVGSTAMGTDLRDQEWSADQSVCHRFLVCAAHRVHAIREIWFDGEIAWTQAGGVAARYAGYLTVIPVLEGSAANAINLGPRMGASRIYAGCAYVYLAYKVTGNGKKGESPFLSSVPTRVTIVGDGAPFYDPRLDSTVPGGSGPMRADDQSTWAWNPAACRNPALATLWFLLGWRINGRLSVGKGIPASRIDLASFIAAANICDEPVARPDGTFEPRYRCDGVWNEEDDPGLVLDNLKSCMNAVLDDDVGRIRVTVLHNDLAVPAGDLTTDDVLGDFTWVQTPLLDETINVIRGGYTDPSPASLYQLADYPEVRIDSPDGIDRAQPVNLPLVQSSTQAQRLVKLRLGRVQYGGTFTAVFQATAWKYQKGDVLRFSFLPLGWSQKLFRIADMAIQVDGTVPLMLREEHPAIYAAYNDATAAIAGTLPTSYDPSLWPVRQAIEEAGKTGDWSQIDDDDGNRPEDGATKGAPEGTEVAGRPAQEVIADLDVVKSDLLTEMLRNVTFRGETDELTHLPDGTPVRTVTQVLSALVNDAVAYVADQRSVDGNGNVKAATVLNSHGHLTGVVQLNDGTIGSFYVVADEFGFIDPADADNPFAVPTKPLSYVNGRLRLTDTDIDGDLVVAGSIKTGGINQFAVRRSYSAQLASNVTLPYATGSVFVTSISVPKEIAASDLVVEWMMRMRPGGTYAGYFELSIGGTVVDTVWYWQGTAEISSVRSVRGVQPYRRRFPGIAAGTVSVSLRFVYFGHDGGTGSGFIEAGSDLMVEEQKR